MRLTPDLVREAEERGKQLLEDAQRAYLEAATPRLDEGAQRALYARVIGDPRLMHAVIKKYGMDGMRAWTAAMLAPHVYSPGDGRGGLAAEALGGAEGTKQSLRDLR